MTSETRPGRGSGLVGTSLEGRYRIDALIARGGMSVVYRGVDTRLHRPVAIKVMDTSHIANPALLRHFRDLAEANDIPYQLEILPRGGTDAGPMQRVRSGAPANARRSRAMCDWS